jgi:DNA-binding IclR family transcriptional regulator
MRNIHSTERVNRRSDGMKTVTTALQMLSLFNAYAPEWTIRDLATRMDMPYSTTYRYVGALVAEGYLEPSAQSGAYRVGLPVIELAGVVLNELDVRVHGQLYLERLADATALNANLAVLYRADILHVSFAVRCPGTSSYPVIGRRSPAHLTAMGKAMLADLYFGDVRRLIEEHGWRVRTPNSIRSFDDLERELAQVRAQGYALDLGEYSVQTRCVAAPIRGRLGRVVAAVSVSDPVGRVTDERLNELPPTVMDYAAMISHHLGYDEMFDGPGAFGSA